MIPVVKYKSAKVVEAKNRHDTQNGDDEGAVRNDESVWSDQQRVVVVKVDNLDDDEERHHEDIGDGVVDDVEVMSSVIS